MSLLPFQILFFLGLLGIAGCGKPTEIQSAPARGDLLSYVHLPEALTATRLLSAGCIQFVGVSNRVVAEFSAQDCPSVPALLPLESIVFSLSVEISASGNEASLKKDGVLVGEISRTDSASPWLIRHLCQISDVALPADGYFAEICRLDFESEFGPRVGRFRALEVVDLQDLARSKVSEEQALKGRELLALKQSAEMRETEQKLRQEKEEALVQWRASSEMLAEAQRGVRDSVASNLTVHRGLERTKAEAELEAAKSEVQYLELSIRFAKAEQRRAGLLKERLEESERAKNRETELMKQIEALKQQNPNGGAEDIKQLQVVLDQNRNLIFSDEVRRKFEEEATFAASDAEKLTELEKEKLPAALNRAVEKKRQLSQLERLPVIEAAPEDVYPPTE